MQSHPVSEGESISDPGRLLDEHGDYLFSFAMSRLRNVDAAEDAVQETLLAAIRTGNTFAGQSSVRTWLVGILKHKIIDYFRKSQRERAMSELSDEDDDLLNQSFDRVGHWASGVPDWKANPQKLLEDKQFMSALRDCLSKLPGRLADVFVLREMDGLDCDEVCRQLGITETNLYATLHRARFRLRKCIEINWLNRA